MCSSGSPRGGGAGGAEVGQSEDLRLLSAGRRGGGDRRDPGSARSGLSVVRLLPPVRPPVRPERRLPPCSVQDLRALPDSPGGTGLDADENQLQTGQPQEQTAKHQLTVFRLTT